MAFLPPLPAAALGHRAFMGGPPIGPGIASASVAHEFAANAGSELSGSGREHRRAGFWAGGRSFWACAPRLGEVVVAASAAGEVSEETAGLHAAERLGPALAALAVHST